MGFPKVRQPRPPTREMEWLDRPTMQTNDRGSTTFAGGLQTGGQVRDLGGGNFGVSAAPGAYGDTSPNYYDDPTVNQFAKLPSLEEAMQYMGSKPTFKGVQRPGDYQRVVQRQMADEASGGQLNDLIEQRVEGSRADRNDFSASPYSVARAMGDGSSAFQGDNDTDAMIAKMRSRFGRGL